MYSTGVLVENPTMGNAFFRKRMGYVNPDRASTANVATTQYGFQANWRGKTHFTTPLISGVHTGAAPGQEIETSLYQVRAMNPPWPPVATHRTDMINPSWQANVSAYGGHTGTIEMLAGGYQQPLPMANDLLEEISAQAIDEHKRKAAFDPLSATYAMEHRGIAEVLETDRAAALSKYRESVHKDPRDPTYRIMDHSVDDTTRSRDSGRKFAYEKLKRWKDMAYTEYNRVIPPPTVAEQIIERSREERQRNEKEQFDRTIKNKKAEMSELREVSSPSKVGQSSSSSSSSSSSLSITPEEKKKQLMDNISQTLSGIKQQSEGTPSKPNPMNLDETFFGTPATSPATHNSNAIQNHNANLTASGSGFGSGGVAESQKSDVEELRDQLYVEYNTINLNIQLVDKDIEQLTLKLKRRRDTNASKAAYERTEKDLDNKKTRKAEYITIKNKLATEIRNLGGTV